jgi:tRNA nucleotidyltransferase/poly(A) polymerase
MRTSKYHTAIAQLLNFHQGASTPLSAWTATARLSHARMFDVPSEPHCWHGHGTERKFSSTSMFSTSSSSSQPPPASPLPAVQPTFRRFPFQLSADELDLFQAIRSMIKDYKLKTTVRVAGGWVRDRLLVLPSAMSSADKGPPTVPVLKNDVDLTVDNMSGLQFVKLLNKWLLAQNVEDEAERARFTFGIIKENPEKSKHLETVSVHFRNLSVDVANLRTESYAENSRIPDTLIGTVSEDAFRRDLTINALYYNIHTGAVEDYTGLGLSDLKQGIIRTPLPPLVTVKDDPLRALRIVRFASRFGFRVEAEVAAACRDPGTHHSLTCKVSVERVLQEVQLMLGHRSAGRAVALLHSYGLLDTMLKVPNRLFKPVTAESDRDIGALVPPLSLGKKRMEFNEVAQSEVMQCSDYLVPVGISVVLLTNYIRQHLMLQGRKSALFDLWETNVETSGDSFQVLM